MAAGNRKSSNKRKTQTKKERMAEMEKAQAFRVEVTLWIVVAAARLSFWYVRTYGICSSGDASCGQFFCGIEPWK